jgi:hypothetical protein
VKEGVMGWTLEKVSGLLFAIIAPPTLLGIFVICVWAWLCRRRRCE